MHGRKPSATSLGGSVVSVAVSVGLASVGAAGVSSGGVAHAARVSTAAAPTAARRNLVFTLISMLSEGPRGERSLQTNPSPSDEMTGYRSVQQRNPLSNRNGSAATGDDGAHREQPRPELDRLFVDRELALVDVVHAATRSPRTESSHRARYLGEVPREVLPAERLLRRRDRVRPEGEPCGSLEHRDGARIVLDGGHASRVAHLDLDLVRREHLLDRREEHLARLLPRADVEAAQRSLHRTGTGDDVVGTARRDGAPREVDARARVEAASEDRGHLRDDLTEREHDVTGEVRARGVTARRGDHDLDLVRCRGDRTDARTDTPYLEPRVAVHGEDLSDSLEPARAHDVERSARLHLFGGLEDEPHPDGQEPCGIELGEHESRPEHHRGVHVVPASMGDTSRARGPRQAALVLESERVEVGTQG